MKSALAPQHLLHQLPHRLPHLLLRPSQRRLQHPLPLLRPLLHRPAMALPTPTSRPSFASSHRITTLICAPLPAPAWVDAFASKTSKPLSHRVRRALLSLLLLLHLHPPLLQTLHRLPVLPSMPLLLHRCVAAPKRCRVCARSSPSAWSPPATPTPWSPA